MTRRAWVLFGAMSAVWGLPYLLIKVAVAEIDPVVVVFLRLAMAALMLLPFSLSGRSLKRVARHGKALVLMATVGIVAPFLSIAYGEQHITSSLAALLIAADPLFVVLLALRMDASERVDGTRLIGLLIGLVGVAALLGWNVGGDELGLFGGALVLLAAVCYGVNALLFKRLGDAPRLPSLAVIMGLSAVLLAPIAVVKLPSQLPSLPALASLVGLGVVCTTLGYILYYELIVEAGATRGSLITYVNPAVAVVLGMLVLSEPIGLGTIVGFVLIVIGCALATRSPKQDVAQPAPRASPLPTAPRRVT